ncbi:MAG: hypothetical protein NVSMB2_02120 [Chloroflexota bacterium]
MTRRFRCEGVQGTSGSTPSVNERPTAVGTRVRGSAARRLLVSFTLGAMLTVLSVCSVFADATPVQLVLLYMPNVSNDGATGASGIAELLLPEGEVRINAANLPHLDGERRYAAWVLNSSNSEFLRLGSFNSSEPTGAVRYETVLPDAIPSRHWNMLLVTVEDNDHPAHPSGSHSIAGIFPRAEGEPLPAVLPNTGGAPDDMPIPQSGSSWPAGSGLAALTLVAGFGAGYVARSRAGAPCHTTSQGTRETRR